jgi:hypothetical protein
MYHVNLVDGEYFLSCAICINLLMAWCERISLGSARCTVPLWKVASLVVSAVSVMAKNGLLCFHATLSGLMGHVFTVVNLFKVPPLLLLSYPIFALIHLAFAKTLTSKFHHLHRGRCWPFAANPRSLTLYEQEEVIKQVKVGLGERGGFALVHRESRIHRYEGYGEALAGSDYHRGSAAWFGQRRSNPREGLC